MDAAVDDADCGCVGIGCDRRDGWRHLRALLILVLGQRDVFRFDDLEDVREVKDEVLEALS